MAATKALLLALLLLTSATTTHGADTATDPAVSELPATGEAVRHRQLDALVLYSPAVSSLYEDAPLPRIEHLLVVSNEAFANSGLDIHLNAVEMAEFPMDDALGTPDLLAKAINDPDMATLRDQHQADIVLLYRPYRSGDGCGTSFVTGRAEQQHLAFAHISVNCSTLTTAHEVGHLLGLGHSHRQGGGGLSEYALGHGVDTVFTTLMAYPDAYQYGPRQLTYSSPDLDCLGFPCGVALDQPEPAHAVQGILDTIDTVIQYRSAREEPADLSNVDILDPVEVARNSYEAFIPIYEATREQFNQLRQSLLDSYDDANTTFSAYATARTEWLTLQQSGSGDPELLTAAGQQVTDTLERYHAALERRDLALDQYVTGFYEVLVPAIQTLSQLRLTYAEELAKVPPSSVDSS